MATVRWGVKSLDVIAINDGVHPIGLRVGIKQNQRSKVAVNAIVKVVSRLFSDI